MSFLCDRCEENPGIYLCGRCFKDRYCGKECQTKSYAFHKRMCFAIDKATFMNKDNRILHVAHEMNLFQEFKALETRMNNPTTVGIFDQGRYYLFKGVVGMIMFDPVRGDMKEEMTPDEKNKWKEFDVNIRKGGELICSESEQSMHDPLIWLFIPKQLHRDIEYTWHGIGSWKH